jgi:hypothetical protein
MPVFSKINELNNNTKNNNTAHPRFQMADAPLRSCQGDLSLFIKSRPRHLSQSLSNRLLPFDPPSPIHTVIPSPFVIPSYGSGDH